MAKDAKHDIVRTVFVYMHKCCFGVWLMCGGLVLLLGVLGLVLGLGCVEWVA